MQIPTSGTAVLFINGEQVPSLDFELRHADEWRIERYSSVARLTRRFIAEWRTEPGGIVHRFEVTNPVEVRELANGVRRYDLWGDGAERGA